MPKIIIIAHDIRSAYNIGSILRTADGLGVKQVYLTGYSPFPQQADDPRLPHDSARITKLIHKTALGAENHLGLYVQNFSELAIRLREDGYKIVALEQHKSSVRLNDLSKLHKIALVLGSEVDGMSGEILKQCDLIAEIPMLGEKESFNVSVATAIAVYHLTYLNL